TDTTRSSDTQGLYELIQDAAQIAIRNPLCPGDLDYNGFVLDNDFVRFSQSYNVADCADPDMPAGCPADLNRDTIVDDADFAIFATAYDRLICP
ncbi:MAG: hypothetical protein ACK58T_29645, partial [Phycisphaerae bacterium]